MQTAPSASDDTIHKQLLIPKRTTPSVNKLNYIKKRTTPSVNKLNYIKNGRHHPSKLKEYADDTSCKGQVKRICHVDRVKREV